MVFNITNNKHQQQLLADGTRNTTTKRQALFVGGNFKVKCKKEKR
jgi:hypothetical protein